MDEEIVSFRKIRANGTRLGGALSWLPLVPPFLDGIPIPHAPVGRRSLFLSEGELN